RCRAELAPAPPARPSVLAEPKPRCRGGFTPPRQIKGTGVPAGWEPRGAFGADMQVYSQNDGPVTILLDTDQM
ncbi:D-aminoacyl-tRNA deacylase, partial [Flavonifractor plautii]|uniref:D-aminoacyl-tRNA deacylase n=2 Tax=Flavonifractor plautii TaxID=292800 RepID=UPI001D0982EB